MIPTKFPYVVLIGSRMVKVAPSQIALVQSVITEPAAKSNGFFPHDVRPARTLKEIKNMPSQDSPIRYLKTLSSE